MFFKFSNDNDFEVHSVTKNYNIFKNYNLINPINI